MSDWNDQLLVLEAHWRTADGNLGAGAFGISRGVGNGEELGSDYLPHVYGFEPVELSEEIAFAQERRTTRFLFDYWGEIGAAQDAVATVLDAFETAVEGDRTLSGNVDKARVVDRRIFESGADDAPDDGQVRRLARVEVETVRDD